MPVCVPIDISEEDEENVAGPPTGVDEEDKFYTEPPIDGNDDVYTRPPIDDDEEEEEDIYGGPQTTEGPDGEDLLVLTICIPLDDPFQPS